jgi:hypothetical protein
MPSFFDRPAQPDPHGSIYKGCEAMLVKAGYLFPSFRERGGGGVGHVQFQPASPSTGLIRL